MIPRDFDAITKADIETLVTNAVAEGRAIEYKQQLPSNGDEDKKEFLADVSSFANAGGGDIVFGVVEKRDGDNKPTNRLAGNCAWHGWHVGIGSCPHRAERRETLCAGRPAAGHR